jgi:hypothetical protein
MGRKGKERMWSFGITFGHTRLVGGCGGVVKNNLSDQLPSSLYYLSLSLSLSLSLFLSLALQQCNARLITCFFGLRVSLFFCVSLLCQLLAPTLL